MNERSFSPQIIPAVDYDTKNNALLLLDQTLLPQEEKILCLTEKEEIWQAINILQVRGAPAIGIAAGLGLAVLAQKITAVTADDFIKELKVLRDYLASARPTAVNLFWALDRLYNLALQKKDLSIQAIKDELLAEALLMREEDISVCQQIGEHGLTLLKPHMGILTHCNAGQLASICYGTALAPIYLGEERGYNFRVFADETRPLLQGARLTAYELTKAGINTTVICDNMAAAVMQKGWIQAVMVGCDRVAANGDVANKIGTLGVAILAKYYNIPFYVCAPTSTIDLNTDTGADIEIEQRSQQEITSMWYEKPLVTKKAKVYNPAFDVTEHKLISALITEKGLIRAPYKENLSSLINK
ncbi:MAG: S-methyl-5-thioribose-1-phosphate isomerase [Bacillota bacterium]|jgi:methylthioribose-1-phosphate isomerase